MSAAKVERLLNLSAALLAAERPLTAAEIRRRVPGYPEERASFRRTFERDKDDLRELGRAHLLHAVERLHRPADIERDAFVNRVRNLGAVMAQVEVQKPASEIFVVHRHPFAHQPRHEQRRIARRRSRRRQALERREIAIRDAERPHGPADA